MLRCTCVPNKVDCEGMFLFVWKKERNSLFFSQTKDSLIMNRELEYCLYGGGGFMGRDYFKLERNY